MKKLKKKVCEWFVEFSSLTCFAYRLQEVTMKFVEVSRATRSKKKCVTLVVGLKTFGKLSYVLYSDQCMYTSYALSQKLI